MAVGLDYFPVVAAGGVLIVTFLVSFAITKTVTGNDTWWWGGTVPRARLLLLLVDFVLLFTFGCLGGWERISRVDEYQHAKAHVF